MGKGLGKERVSSSPLGEPEGEWGGGKNCTSTPSFSSHLYDEVEGESGGKKGGGR